MVFIGGPFCFGNSAINTLKCDAQRPWNKLGFELERVKKSDIETKSKVSVFGNNLRLSVGC